SRSARELRQARLDRDDRGGRLARFRHVLRALLEPPLGRRQHAASGDRHRRPRLRGREGLTELHPHTYLPERLPALARGDSTLRRPAYRPAYRRTQGPHATLRRDAAALARQL